MRHSDLPLLQRWLQLPHVDAWWHTPLDAAGVRAKYGLRLSPRAFVLECGHAPRRRTRGL